MKPLLFELSAAPGLAASLSRQLDAEQGELDRRQFPDGESYLRFETPVNGRNLLLLCTLDRPDPKLAPLLFAAAAARAQGAVSVGLVAPYLGYMRQDKQFHDGEAVTSKTFADLLSSQIDWLVTLDPHLHRYPGLDALYAVPALAATAAEQIADWIRDNVELPVLVGPDEESEQWVARIAALAEARSTVLRKTRSGDYSVRIDPAGLGHLGNGTPVVIDDIASSARTLIEAVRLLKAYAARAPLCAVVHPIFAGDSFARLAATGVARVVSTNTIEHESNAIDISAPLARAIRDARAAAAATPVPEPTKD